MIINAYSIIKVSITNNEDVRRTEDDEVIKKTKNEIYNVGEFESPAEAEKYEQEVMIQSGGKATNEDVKNMSDDISCISSCC
ncbi:hypothetical protein [Staphylococcus equorum]|uniref:hypothetical protein n=1 Tax=Staphylococcus equorum TaxID=246432 RepID=UPI000D1CBF68|nr:hypothetical protein [Staphylococcus equorum]PTE83582.1 hypothetical protein BUY90_11255 [Staphylococcus equorum]